MTPEQPEIDYPCTWEYKVIGVDRTVLKEIIVAACSPLEVMISHSRTSSKGKYHSLKVQVTVTDENIRLKIYKTLQTHPSIKYVL